MRPLSQTAYSQELKKLNAGQLEAVQTIEGPVMVVAGPGTGKTQVLALRIAEILSQTQLEGKNVLALTFTEAGVTALRNRLNSLIGPVAYQVAINTFHGFAKTIIDSMPFLFSDTNTLEQIDEHEKFTIIQKILIEDESLKALRPVRSPYWHTKDVCGYISTLKREAVSPARLVELAKLERDKDTGKNKAKSAILQSTADKLEDLSSILGQYQGHLYKIGLYDYDDMIPMVVKTLSTYPDIKSFYQEKYQYILVDEYQDTNTSQNQLVETLADFFETPNLFVVGDDKQAIFRFQGASVANMLYFKHKYPDLKIINLKENYRSDPDILKVATSLINHNTRQLKNFMPDLITDLVAAKPHQLTPTIARVSNLSEEDIYVVERVKKHLASGVKPNEIAVLVKTNFEVSYFSNLLMSSGVEVSAGSVVDIAESPRIAKLCALLQAINKPNTNYPLLEALPFLVQMDLIEQVQIQEASRRDEPLLILLKQRRPDVYDLVQKLHRDSQSAGVDEIVSQVLSETAYLKVVAKDDSRFDHLSEVGAFVEYAKAYSQRHPSAQLGDFLSYFEKTKGDKIEISMPSIFSEQTGVFVSTIHRSKGLEFEAVLMPRMTVKSWKTKERSQLVRLPSEIITIGDFEDDFIEDERRLCYVAMTRAKKYLNLSLSEGNEAGESISPSLFIEEMADCLQAELVEIADDTAKEVFASKLTGPTTKQLEATHLAYIREMISRNPLSPTGLSAYKECPQRFLLKEVFRFPEPISQHLIYGTAVHKALEEFYTYQKIHKSQPSLDEFLSVYATAIGRNNTHIVSREGLKQKGLDILRGYYPLLCQMPAAVFTEYNLRSHHIEVDGVWITGKFDKIELIDSVAKTVRVIDYKTGAKAKSRGEIEGTTKTSQGNIIRQLIFYKLLSDSSSQFPYKVTELAIRFVDDEMKFKEEIFKINPEQIAVLKEDIVTTHKEMLTRTSFPHTYEKYADGCELCIFG